MCIEGDSVSACGVGGNIGVLVRGTVGDVHIVGVVVFFFLHSFGDFLQPSFAGHVVVWQEP